MLDSNIDKILSNIKYAIENKKPLSKQEDDEIIELTNVITGSSESIVSDATANKIHEYVKNLTEKSVCINKNNRVLSNEEIKEVFKDTLKPYLKSWLNNNLSNIVKEVVEKEMKLLLTKVK